MKPNVEEQLHGTCRILETVVAPHVGEPFARTILDGLIANLRMLTNALPAVAGFLRHDNQATVQLLTALCGTFAGELAERLDQLLDEPDPDVADTAALDERNRQLRELLTDVACCEDLSPEQHRVLVQQMSERASRMPMRYVSTAPTPPPRKET